MIRAFRVTSLTGAGVLALGTIFSACSGPDKTEPPPPGYQGDFTLQRYLNVVPGNAPESFLFAEAHFYTTNGDLDAGNRLVLTGPAGDQVLVRREFLGRILYQKDPETDIPPAFFVPGASYSIRVPGSSRSVGVSEFTLDPVLTLPAAFTLTAPDCTNGITVDGTADVTFTWPAGDGQFVDLFVQVVTTANVVHAISYRSPDDGDYTWTTGQIGLIAKGTGTLTVIRVIPTDHVLPDEGIGAASGGDAVTCTLVRQ